MQQLVLAMLLDDGGRGLARALAGLTTVVMLALFVAVLLPIAVLTNVGMAAVARAPAAGPVGEPTARLPTPLANGGPVPPAGAPALAGAKTIDVARRYLGVRYVFGGTDPAIGLDCSGLVQLVFRQLGVSLPRTAQLQYDATPRVTQDQLQPGDLVFFARTYPDPRDWITHVGIYIGGGQQINAPTEGQVVSIQPVFSGFWGAHFAAGGRVPRT
jgi:cell wall-associated NlpC family hydrolase